MFATRFSVCALLVFLAWAEPTQFLEKAEVDTPLKGAVATAAVVTDEAVATLEKQEDAKVTELAVKEITMPENTYQATGPTAEALAVIFMGVCLMICWIECCK